MHRPDFTDIGILLVFTDYQNRFCLVFEFGSNMTSGVIVILVKMQHATSTGATSVHSSHEHSHHICRFLGIVDVIHEISQAVYNDQSYILKCPEGIIYEGNT